MKVFDFIKHPSKILLKLDNYNLIRLSDERYLKILYKSIFNKKLDLENPKTFNEKLNWLKLHDRKPIYTTMVDKYEAKKYVADIIGEEYIIPTLGIYNSFDEIDFDKLPNQFVMKCTHDSGGIVICRDKNNFDVDKARKIINKSLKNNFYYVHREWAYKNVKPRIIIEEYIGDNLIDYRLYCFNGEVEYIYQYINESQIDNTKPEPINCNIYDCNWNLQNFHQASLPTKKTYRKPKQINNMIKLSKKLSKRIPFLRVDFYIINKKIYFGELTLYPGGGLSAFYPSIYDEKIGDKLVINGFKR